MFECAKIASYLNSKLLSSATEVMYLLNGAFMTLDNALLHLKHAGEILDIYAILTSKVNMGGGA